MIWFVLVYFVGWFLTAVLAARDLRLDRERRIYRMTEDDMPHAMSGALIAIFWPVVLPLLVIKKISNY